jgi:acetyltransferase-like isoleucine patch superfamily enzyme
MSPRLLLFALVFVSPPFLKKWLLRWFCGAKIGRGARISWLASVVGTKVELGEHAAIGPFTLVWADGGVEIGAYSELSAFVLVYGSGAFRCGKQCYVGPMSMINVTEDVTFGDVVAVGPRSMIFTHGSYLPYNEGYWVRFAPVSLGSYVWLAAGAYVSPGARIGSNVFVHPRSLVAGDVADGSVMQGNPATEIDRMERLRREMTARRLERAIEQVLDHFAEVWPTLGRGVHLEEREQKSWRFRLRGRRYRVAMLGADQLSELAPLRDGVHRVIAVCHGSKLDWDRLPRGVHVFDLETMQTDPSRDPIHAALFRFMNWYYGIKFTYREPKGA